MSRRPLKPHRKHQAPNHTSPKGTDNFVCGTHAVVALLSHTPQRAKCLFLTEELRNSEAALLAKEHGVMLQITDKASLALKVGPDQHHQGLVLSCAPFSYANLDDLLREPCSLVLVLDGVEDPRNLGRAARSALAFGADFLLIPKDRACPITATVERAAVGALSSLPVVQVQNLAQALKSLKEAGIWVVGTAMDAPTATWDFDFKTPTAIVIGSEESGMRRLTLEACDALVQIPMAGGIESLNAADAAGLLLYESMRQRQSLK